MSGYTQFPTSYSAGPAAPSQYDIKAISEAIDRAASSLKEGERGSLTVQIDQKGAGAGLIVRGPQIGPFKTGALATILKPKAGPLGWSASFRASFLVAPEEPKPVRVAPELRGLYRLFRQRGSNPVSAAIKAVKVNGGLEVRL